MSRTGFVTAPVFLQHDTGPTHPERPARITAVLEELERSGLGAELACAEASPVEERWVEEVHSHAHVERIRMLVESGERMIDGGDTVVSARSFDAALAAAGGAVGAAQRVLAGEWANAFVLARPPGHHAEKERAMGFCLFNNAAVCARWAQREGGLERVAILDWDVHHGNGTQHLFERDPSVFYASLHQWPHYPGTGAADERGIGAGEGATLNCPMSAGWGDAEYLATLEETVLPALEEFRPQLLIVSAGFDAHELDPLSGTRVTSDGFRRMSEMVAGFARGACEGRIVSLLEGGYDLQGLAESTAAHLSVLRDAGAAG